MSQKTVQHSLHRRFRVEHGPEKQRFDVHEDRPGKPVNQYLDFAIFPEELRDVSVGPFWKNRAVNLKLNKRQKANGLTVSPRVVVMVLMLPSMKLRVTLPSVRLLVPGDLSVVFPEPHSTLSALGRVTTTATLTLRTVAPLGGSGLDGGFHELARPFVIIG